MEGLVRSMQSCRAACHRPPGCRCVQGSAEGAAADFRQVLALEPQNRQAREELKGLEAMLERQLPGGGF